MTNKCIAVLTRGYNNLISYNKLIKRNIHIDNHLEDKTIDILIFHEGNITNNQQEFIKNKTPLLNIIFINISNIAFKADKQNIKIEDCHSFKLGYRHMCSFWFVNFFDAVKNYDKLIRIDEDCFINSSIDYIFLQLDKYLFISGMKKVDGGGNNTTRGLYDFTLDFINKHKDEYEFKKTNEKRPIGPYTNLFGISLTEIQENKMFKIFKNHIDKSNMIYKRRWGDLPLWGKAIYHIFGEEKLKINTNIKYFHESHNFQVN